MTASSPVAEGERAEEGNSFGLFVCCGEGEGHGVQNGGFEDSLISLGLQTLLEVPVPRVVGG